MEYIGFEYKYRVEMKKQYKFFLIFFSSGSKEAQVFFSFATTDFLQIKCIIKVTGKSFRIWEIYFWISVSQCQLDYNWFGIDKYV